MTTVRKSDRSTLTGLPALGALATIATTQILTAFVMAFPLSWLASHVFGGGVALHALLGESRLSYWRCVGLYAIWFAVRIRIKFSGPAKITLEGKQ